MTFIFTWQFLLFLVVSWYLAEDPNYHWSLMAFVVPEEY